MGEDIRLLDIRKIDGPYTPADQFFTAQHHGHPQIDGESYRLKITGLVERPGELSLDEIKALGESELVAGFECSGNSPRAMQSLASNARWSGVPLRKLLSHVGTRANGREIVFFGADSGTEEVEFRGRKYEVDQQYGRSMSVDDAIVEMELLDHDFFLFQNIETDGFNVIYKRTDGDYGLIEPEAS